MPPCAVPNRIHGLRPGALLRHHGGMRPSTTFPSRYFAALMLIAALALSACGKSSTHWNGPGGPGGNTNDGGKVGASISEPNDGATGVPAAAEITYRTKN